MLLLKINRKINTKEFWQIFNNWIKEIPRKENARFNLTFNEDADEVKIPKPAMKKLTEEQIKQNRKDYYQRNKETIKKQVKIYHTENQVVINEKNKLRARERRENL